MNIKVKKSSTIQDYLEILGYKKSNIKKLFKYHLITINGKQAKYNDEVIINDQIEILETSPSPIEIIYEDKEILVINKPSGLISDEVRGKKNAYSLMKDYAYKKHESLYLVHRLDEDTSGVLMFVKDKALAANLTKGWNNLVKVRSYMAIVCGKMEGKGTIDNYLSENKAQIVYIAKKGKRAITHYEVIKNNKDYSLVHVLIDTGRKNQIRVHLSSINHPILGDKKYGNKQAKRLYLHSDRFGFIHPKTKKYLEFEASIPDNFKEII